MTKALQYYRENEVVNNELYRTQVTDLIVVKDEFHAIWPNLAPGKSLINKIGSASGVEFLPSIKTDPEYGDEIINPDGSRLRKQCGVTIVVQGRKMRPDGSWQYSSPCPYTFNWDDRAELDFLADEEAGKGKYNSPIKKRKHVLELKKFGTQRASTGAQLKVIRELTGMPTAFKEQELTQSGWKMSFSQIIKSEKHQAAEAHAKIENIRNGGQIGQGIESASLQLTGVSAGFENTFDRPDEQPEVVGEVENDSYSSGYTPPETITPEPDPIPDVSECRVNVEKMLGDERTPQDFRKWAKGELEKYQYSDDVCNFVAGEIRTKVFREV